MMTPGQHVLEGRNLTRHYDVGGGFMRKPKIVRALDGVDFTLDAGKTLAVVGESGCGKSTLARLVTMIEPPTGGELWIDGRKLDYGDSGTAPRRADRLPEPLRLAQPAPEDRGASSRSRCCSTPPTTPRRAASRPRR